MAVKITRSNIQGICTITLEPILAKIADINQSLPLPPASKRRPASKKTFFIFLIMRTTIRNSLKKVFLFGSALILERRGFTLSFGSMVFYGEYIFSCPYHTLSAQKKIKELPVYKILVVLSLFVFYHLNIYSNIRKNKRKKDELKKELENQEAILACAREFNMIGDPTRLKICYLLCRHKELSVSEIAEVVGVSISAVSHTLRKLKKANMVKSHRESRTVYYQLKHTGIVNILRQRFADL